MTMNGRVCQGTVVLLDGPSRSIPWIRLFFLIFLLCLCSARPFAAIQETEQPAASQKTPGQEDQDTKPNQEPPQQESSSGARLGVISGFPIGGGNLSTEGLRERPSGDPSQASVTVKRVEFVGAPIPIINPTVGNGLAGVGAIAVHLDPNDKRSPPSIFGVGAAFTSNGSRGWGVLSELFLKEDRFRILALFGQGRVNYNYYGSGHLSAELGLFLPLELDVVAFVVEPKVRAFGRWYLGPRYHTMGGTVAIDLNKVLHEFPGFPSIPNFPEIPPIDFKVRAAALGVRVQRDSRDSQFYPRRGSFFDTTLDFYEPQFGSDRSYQKYDFSYQGYHSLLKKNVIAYRGDVCLANGTVPFFEECSFGSQKDIMGYSVGKYQDRRMIVGQIQFRRELVWRLGAVGTFGAGEVAKKFSEFSGSNVLPGGGLGMRFLLAKENHINLTVDYAWGKNSNALYISIGESF